MALTQGYCLRQSIGHNEIQIFNRLNTKKYFNFLPYNFDSLEISVELIYKNRRYFVTEIINH